MPPSPSDAHAASEQWRVMFDFDLTFSNGGGLQGQGFRLDIPGMTIDDAALAAYIIKDLRLLMVDKVRILNKQMLREAHKRPAAPEPDGAPFSR